MTQQRSNDETRADIAVMDASAMWSDRYHDALIRVLRDIEPLLARAERAEALISRRLGDCIGCTTEPDETCPRDGRTYAEWVNIASDVISRENAAREVLEQAAHWHVYESRDIGEAFLADTVRDWVDEVAAALAAGLSLQEEQE